MVSRTAPSALLAGALFMLVASVQVAAVPMIPPSEPTIEIYTDSLAPGFFDFSFPIGANFIDFHFDGIVANGTSSIFAALVPFGALRYACKQGSISCVHAPAAPYSAHDCQAQVLRII